MRHARKLLRHSLEPSTRRGYQQQLRRHWFPFLQLYNFRGRPTARTLFLFVAWAGRRTRSVDKILSAVRHHYNFSNASWERRRLDARVVNALKGLRKLTATPVKRSPPLLPAHLRAFAQHALRPDASYDDLLAAAIATIGFGALMRLGELVAPSRVSDRDPRKVIRRDSVKLGPATFSFHLPFHKADRLWHGSTVTIVRENSTPDFDFVTLLQLYLARRDSLFPRATALLLTSSGSPPTRSFFVSRLRALAPGVTAHGLRAGGATFLASRSVPPTLIQRLGRWSSDQWTIYVRDNPAVAAAMQRLELR